ncbi:MAG: DUF4097 family beta strand repeat-containing protein [Syntrophothermus sp.]
MSHYKSLIAALFVFTFSQVSQPAARPEFFAGPAIALPGAAVKTSEDDLDGKPKIFKVEKGGTLDVSLNIGSVYVTTSDKNEITVGTEGLADQDYFGVKTSQSGNNVTIEWDETESSPDDFTLVITMPSDFNVKLRTLSGNLKITGGMKGDLKGTTAGGDIGFGNVEGKVDVNTSGGSIIGGNIASDARLNTAGGDVQIGNINGEAEIKTMGGNISAGDVAKTLNALTYGGEIMVGKIGGDSEISTYGGDIQAKGLTGSIKISTMGGDIAVDNGKGNLSAKTMGGDITVGGFTGTLNASTASGDVKISMTPAGDEISGISTMNGTITLSVPENIKAEINAQIRYGGDSVKVSSDFESTTYNQSHDKIRAQYILNGGGGKINLKATNGDIIIKKMVK